MTKIFAFDFDGTLTYKDSLLEFIRYTQGNLSFVLGFMLYSPLLILMKLHAYPNWKVKQQLFSYYFKNCPIDTFNKYCDDFGREYVNIIREKGMSAIRKAILEGGKVLIVSASIDNWVAPFFKGLDVRILGTRIEIVEGKVTGRFLTNNCYGKEKVKRIQELYPDRKNYMLVAFGDSRGDKEMLEYADKGYYRPF